MSSFNKIKKVIYQSPSTLVISLKEYIIFEDESNKDKFLVFKFEKNLVQKLLTFICEIKQYDENNCLIASSEFKCSEEYSRDKREFVPFGKFRIDYKTTKIECNLVYAKFERSTFENGILKDTSKDFDEYIGQEYDKIQKLNKKELKKAYKKEIKRKKYEEKLENKKAKYDLKILKIKNNINEGKYKRKELKQIFKREQIINKYKPGKGNKGLKIFLSVVSLLGIIVGVIITSYTKIEYLNNDLNYSLVSFEDKTVIISSYEGIKNEVVTIPKTSKYKRNIYFQEVIDYISKKSTFNPFDPFYYEFQVIGVEKGGFKNSKISQVKISPDSIFLKDEAFYNTPNLTSIDYDKITSIGQKCFYNSGLVSFNSSSLLRVGNEAFSNCSYLSSFQCENAIVNYGAFKGDNRIKTIEIKEANNCNTFADLFETTNNKLPKSLTKIVYHGEVKEGFFYGINPNQVSLYLDYEVDDPFGLLVNSQEDQFSNIYKVEDNEITFFNQISSNKIEINSGIYKISQQALNQLKQTNKSYILYINEENFDLSTLDKDLFSGLCFECRESNFNVLDLEGFNLIELAFLKTTNFINFDYFDQINVQTISFADCLKDDNVVSLLNEFKILKERRLIFNSTNENLSYFLSSLDEDNIFNEIYLNRGELDSSSLDSNRCILNLFYNNVTQNNDASFDSFAFNVVEGSYTLFEY